MNWIRVSTTMADDPRTHELAAALGVRVAEAGGLIVFLLTKFPAHAPTGNLSRVPDSLLEMWAAWEGERGAFASAFRATFLDDAGTWAAWQKHNGQALQKLERDKERLANLRSGRGASSEDVAGSVAGSVARQSRDNTRDGRAGVAGTNGRTDVRTAVGAHVRVNGNGNRVGSGDLVPIRPHLPAVLVAPPFCTGCEGEPVTAPSGRITGMRHAATCTARQEVTA